jgi:hypothetical protein
MPDQGPSLQNSRAAARHSDRTVWIITGYAASALALLGVLAYYFAAYVTK